MRIHRVFFFFSNILKILFNLFKLKTIHYQPILCIYELVFVLESTFKIIQCLTLSVRLPDLRNALEVLEMAICFLSFILLM